MGQRTERSIHVSLKEVGVVIENKRCVTAGWYTIIRTTVFYTHHIKPSPRLFPELAVSKTNNTFLLRSQ